MFYLRKQHIYRNESEGEGDSGGGEADTQVDAVVDTPDDIEKASKMGWTDKADFKGDPAKWRPAKEYLERGETMLPILRKTVEKQERKIDELQKSIKEFGEYHTKTEQRAYERAIKELKGKQFDAVQTGNTEAFVAIDKEIAELQKEASTKPAIGDTKNGEHPDYQPWLEKNKWAEDDPLLAEEAEIQALYLRNKGSKLQGMEFLESVAKRVKERFPDKFKNPRRESAPSVEGSTPPARKGGRSYADMPADARAACDRMAKNIYSADAKQQAAFKAEYVKTYFEGN
ncbi:MAG: hypothetical protein ACXWJZ_01475 [Burkholderiaceae bacterium]